MMTLREAIHELSSFDAASAIYAREPWTASSQVVIATESEAGGLPPEADRLGFKYFLDVHVAQTVLEGWIEQLRRRPTLDEKCERLIHYALTDA